MDAGGSQAYPLRRRITVMRIPSPRVWLPLLALVAIACAPHHCPKPPHGPGMMAACGPDACWYKSRCFSEGAMHSNDGVCQSCSGGKWVAAGGCREDACHECGGMSAPCDHAHRRRPPGH